MHQNHFQYHRSAERPSGLRGLFGAAAIAVSVTTQSQAHALEQAITEMHDHMQAGYGYLCEKQIGRAHV